MGAPKHDREAIDLTDDAGLPHKHARISYDGVPLSSQTADALSSQLDSLYTPASSLGASQATFGDEEAIDLTQEDDGSVLEFYGTMETKIVGVRYYNGVATPGELVNIRREPQNQYDRNAIRIDNVMANQIGHLSRKVAEKLAGYIDQNELVLEGMITNIKGQFDCPMRLHFFGTSDPSARLELEEKLKGDKLLKATQLNTTRKEAEASRKATGLKSDTTSVGLGVAAGQLEENESSLHQLLAASEAMDTRKTEDITDNLGVNEDTLKAMPMADQPGALKLKLFDYQLQGLKWMIAKENPQLPAPNSKDVAQLWKRSGNTRWSNLGSGFVTSQSPTLFSGGILADDMGLGKTLQIISLILSEPSSGPTLIVAPVTVLSNWEKQMKDYVHDDHAPSVVVYHSKAMSAAELRGFGVVITSYGMISQPSNNPKCRSLLSVDWRRVVLDEGHTIRNAKTAIAKAARQLRAKSRWVLTGTPIINSVKDFLSILQFLRLTGGLEDDGLFSQAITRPIRQLHNFHPDRFRAVKLLAHLMQDICLRRRKDMQFVNLGLPPKSEFVHRIPFTSKNEQTKYDAMLAEAQGKLERFKSQGDGAKVEYASVLERLLRLRQICNHWALCKDRVNNLLAAFEGMKVIPLTDKNIGILQEALRVMIESQEECAICYEEIGLHQPVVTSCKHVFGKPCISKAIEMQGKCPMCRASLTPDALVEPAPETDEVEELDDTKSSKTEALIKIVQATLKNDGSKIVIFSQWTSFLNIVQLRLKEEGVLFCRIDGSMVKAKRDKAINALYTDPNTRILLASLQVCSVGLNLVAADTVILADSWWAPAIEDQAIDRVHRLGQNRSTTVWRLVIEGTIEERVLDIQKEKRQLVSEAFQEKSKKGYKAQETRSMADIIRLLS